MHGVSSDSSSSYATGTDQTVYPYSPTTVASSTFVSGATVPAGAANIAEIESSIAGVMASLHETNSKRWVSYVTNTVTTIVTSSLEIAPQVITQTIIDTPTITTTISTEASTSSSTPTTILTTVTVTAPRHLITAVIVTDPSGAAQATYLQGLNATNGTDTSYATFTDPSGYTWPEIPNSTTFFDPGLAYGLSSELPGTTMTLITPSSSSVVYVKPTTELATSSANGMMGYKVAATMDVNSAASAVAATKDGSLQLTLMTMAMSACLALALML